MQQLALILAICSNKNINVKIYLQCYRIYPTSISFARQLQDKKNSPNSYVKIYPSPKSILQGKNAKFSMIREIPSQVMIQMNVSIINI